MALAESLVVPEVHPLYPRAMDGYRIVNTFIPIDTTLWLTH